MKSLIMTLLFASTSLWARPISFKIEHPQMKKGNVLLALFNDSNEFPDKKSILRQITPALPSGVTVITLDLPDGEYAASVFLDENRNNKLDLNFLGIPKEMFGFSNNPKIFTGPPSFHESEFRVDESSKTLKIKLIKLI